MVISKGRAADTHFLNVDLDIYSTCDLQPLLTALGTTVIVLQIGRIKRTYGAHLEVAKLTKNADATIREFCSLIKCLPRPERQLWNAAKIRDFNIGIQARLQPFCTEFALEAETVRATSELGARIVFSVYAPEKARPTAPTAKTDSNKVSRATC
jgi:hypothetical protein